MEEILKDPRFAHTLKDPRFRQPRVKYTKTKIDKRFKRMLNDKEFTDKYTVDKRGRPINTSAKEKLNRLYDYESESEQSSCSDDPEECKTKSEFQSTSEENKESNEKETDLTELAESDRHSHDSDDDDESLSGNDETELTADGPDYARGAALLESSDEEEATGEGDGEDDDLDLKEEDLLDHHWNELDHDAPTTEASTHRLALCSMDWDRIKAKDIYVLCSSFVPSGGAVKSVTIYPSEEGLQRMAEEARLGPRKFQDLQEEGELGSADKGARSKARDQAVLRKYQLQRLNYYYAVVVCDSVDTADKIYQECNGMEYEKSANRIDLRFIPEDMTFDQEPRETCTGIEDMTNFQPTTYRTTALCQDKVDLTWDETSIDRLKKTMKQFTPEDCENNEGAEFIASSAESSSDLEASDDESGGKTTAIKAKSKETKKKKWAENLRQSLNLKAGVVISKQKKKQKKTRPVPEHDDGMGVMENGESSTSDIGSEKKSKTGKIKNKKKSNGNKSKESDTSSTGIVVQSDRLNEDSLSDEEGGMEYSWQLSARDKVGKSKAKEKLTPWETYQQKKKERKKEKKKKRKLEKLSQQGVDLNNDLGFDDPFFNEEPEADKRKEKKKNKKKAALKKKAGEDEEDDEESRKEKAALGLLVNDGDSHLRGFNLLQLMKEEKARERQKGKKRKQEQAEPDDFKFTLDDRFSNLFTDPDLHIDPNAPEFKKTKGMVNVMEEVSKKKRQKTL